MESVAADIGALQATYDIEDFGPSLLGARRIGDLDGPARAIVGELSAATALVVGSPTYKGSHSWHRGL